jgi:hypothetical protein
MEISSKNRRPSNTSGCSSVILLPDKSTVLNVLPPEQRGKRQHKEKEYRTDISVTGTQQLRNIESQEKETKEGGNGESGWQE